ncbi:hypothetical protein ACFZAU_04255 [Streptomyces sp. NPDC008238]
MRWPGCWTADCGPAPPGGRGAQANYFLTWNASAGRWEQPVALRSGDTLTYTFDYLPAGRTAQTTSAAFTYTAP